MTKVPPILLSAIICERVIFDRITSMPSIINIVQHVNSPKYPVRYAQLVFFCELTNGHGETQTQIKIVDTQENERVIFQQRGSVQFQDVQQVVTVVLNLQGLVFAHPGEYCFQLYAGENLLGERRILCREFKLPPRRPDEQKAEQ